MVQRDICNSVPHVVAEEVRVVLLADHLLDKIHNRTEEMGVQRYDVSPPLSGRLVQVDDVFRGDEVG